MPRSHERQSETTDRPIGTQRPTVPRAGVPDLQRLSVSDAAGLQQLVGNQAVDHLIAQRRMAAQEHTTADDVTPEQIGRVTRGGGKPLDEPILQRAENATGMDMSHVRVHTGADAAASAAAMAARAYTIGPDIVVGKGGGDPETLLHEAKHVEQQARGAVPGRATAGGLRLSHSGDSAEREATRFAAEEIRRPSPGAVAQLDAPVVEHRNAAVQRVTDEVVAESSQAAQTAADDEDFDEDSISDEGRQDPRYVLSLQISSNSIAKKPKLGLWDYFTRPWMKSENGWGREKWRLRRALEIRASRGRTFSPQELALIRELSESDPKWLEKIGIGRYEVADQLSRGDGPDQYKKWVQLHHGQRILAATLAYERHRETPGEPTPISPAYTLGRFMTTQGLDDDDPLRPELENERDAQIRKTAVDTLHPEGLPESERVAVSEPDSTLAHQANEIFRNVLLLLQAGLEIRDENGEYQRYEGDVIRALAHGGRVNVRVPATSANADPKALLTFLGVLDGGKRTAPVARRGIATHHTSITKNRGEQRGDFVEQGEVAAGLRNLVTEYPAHLLEKMGDGLARLFNAELKHKAVKLMGVPFTGGGVGSKDWNGDVVLPDHTHGHLLLVWEPPTGDKDGSLLIGLETIGPGVKSPVGYTHGITSTEATANPESVLHGHKPDKIGAGKTEDNPRMVDLTKPLDGDTGWLDVLKNMKQSFEQSLEDAQGSVEETRALYERLVGPRQNP